MGSSSMTELADTIRESTKILNDYLVFRNCPTPSLCVDGAPISIERDKQDILNAKATLLNATRELQNLIVGPLGILMNIGANEVLCLQIIYRYRIASSFGIHEQTSFEKISESCGLNVIDLRRILRYAMTSHIFCEPQPGIVAHTAASRLIAENPLIQDFIGNVCEIRFPASARTADALDKYGHSQDASQSGYSLSANTARGLYDELAHHPEQARRWTGAMSLLATEIDFDFILHSFAWTSHPAPTILDIGGGRGDVSIGLAKHLPVATFIVQDISAPAREEGARFANPHISFQAYDFRTPQPVQGADILYFRNIFHNWPDRTCVEILRNQVGALKPGARLVIDDFAVQDGEGGEGNGERKRRWMDINMLVFFGSRERTLEEWREMLAAADERFRLVGAKTARGQPNTILEVAWDVGDQMDGSPSANGMTVELGSR